METAMLTSHRRTCLAAAIVCLLNFTAVVDDVRAQHAALPALPALPAVPAGPAAAAQTAQQAAQQAAVAAAMQHHDSLLNAFDANSNGLFDPREIQAAVSNLANLRNTGGAAAGTAGVNPAAFKIFDSNGDGRISPQEVVSAQMMMGVISSAYSSQVRRGFNPFVTQAPEPEVPAVDPRTEARKSRSKANRMARAANQRAKKARADAAKGKAKPARPKPPVKRGA